jgi:hypothetical protein
MLAALSEWFSGELVPYIGDISLFYGKWRESVDIFMVELCGLSEKNLKDWVAYIYNVNRASHTKLRTTAFALPLPMC